MTRNNQSIWSTVALPPDYEFESVPVSFQLGIIMPLYKGGGKDPLDTNSYWGIKFFLS